MRSPDQEPNPLGANSSEQSVLGAADHSLAEPAHSPKAESVFTSPHTATSSRVQQTSENRDISIPASPINAPEDSLNQHTEAGGADTQSGSTSPVQVNAESVNAAPILPLPRSGAQNTVPTTSTSREGAPGAPLGTLVVVQGVVHTTDASPSTSPITADSLTPLSGHSSPSFRLPRTSRLQSLLRGRRPISSTPLAVNPGFTLTDSALTNDQSPASTFERVEGNRQANGTLIGAPIEFGEEGPSDLPSSTPIGEDSPNSESPGAVRERATSLAMSSIEVLGTLLRSAIIPVLSWCHERHNFAALQLPPLPHHLSPVVQKASSTVRRLPPMFPLLLLVTPHRPCKTVLSMPIQSRPLRLVDCHDSDHGTVSAIV